MARRSRIIRAFQMGLLFGVINTAVEGAQMHSALLLSRTCTTGWGDWVHGELWLLEDGILRRSLGLSMTIAHSFDGPGAPDRPRAFGEAELYEIVHAHRTNFLVHCDSIASARLRRGIVTGRLRLELKDGSTRKLLWMKSEWTRMTLEQRLREWLGEALVLG